ncbi:hypothetical protein Vwe01_63970 [Micromonospora andamanensis]|nr:hypothetical protein Vwe01_63970 [Micromonospora andamanensis]
MPYELESLACSAQPAAACPSGTAPGHREGDADSLPVLDDRDRCSGKLMVCLTQSRGGGCRRREGLSHEDVTAASGDGL